MMPRPRKIALTTALSLLTLALLRLPAEAQVAKQGRDTLDRLAFQSDRLAESQPVVPFEDTEKAVDPILLRAWTAFRLSAPVEWSAVVDPRHGRIAFAEGGRIAWIPGRGNSLTLESLAAVLQPNAKKIDLTALETIARNFLPRVSDLLGVDPASLVLNLGRSGQPASHLWLVDFDVVVGSMKVEGARVVFRVNNGNLIQFGSENLPVPGSAVPPVRLTAADALAEVARYIGGFSSADRFSDNGSLHLVPSNIPGGFDFGAGRGLAQVYQLVFHRDGVPGTWQARVDATSGEILELRDLNDYATRQVTGGVRPFGGGSEVVRPLPQITVSPGGTTGSAGLFNWTGATTTASLLGPYVKIVDTCGGSSQASDPFGNLAFGTSTGTDCTTPGHGGAGNTHAAREQLYVVNRFKNVVRSWLPSNTWLNQQLGVNVNLNFTCNAYWNGTTLNFSKSGGGCVNSAENADISIHELGHALDQNDATGSSPDGATGESYADTTSVVLFHKSCIAPDFFSVGNCSGYGDPCTACMGVRDVDFAQHVSNTPATVANFTQVHCAAGTGPCGREVHCESYVPSEAIWDFANRDLPGAGSGAAWTVLDRLWYLSRNTATGAFVCNHASMPFTSNGCTAGNLWKVMRAVDDDDGNLNNGTPHGAALYAAFNRHGIACTTDPGASTSFRGCTQPTTPTLTVTPGDNSAALSWTASGTAVYDVFKNDTGCNAPFTKIVSGGTPTTLVDNDVSNGSTYYYQVTALPAGNEACASEPSFCIAVIPAPGPCVPPAAPALPSATTSPSSVSLVWAPVTGASEYHILRGTVSMGPYTLIGDSVSASYTDSTVTPGTTYYYVVRAANNPTCESGNSPQVIVTAQNFTLSISPFSQTVVGAGTALYTITITRIGGFSGAVTFSSITGLPAGVTPTFSPNPATGTTAVLALSVAITAPHGTFPFTVIGTSGTLVRTATAQLIH